jgi:sporadic carbohydrate cluster 2OG-Fe(II) oxygenase
MIASTNQFVEMFKELGFCQGKLIDCSGIMNIQSMCSSFLEERLGKQFNLTEYHLHVSEEQHRELHYDLTSYLRNARVHHQIVAGNLSIFESLLGNDIDVQTEFYLRISRPGMNSDNIGMHRDTSYGNSAYEISCIYPLVDFIQGAAVGIVPESHKFGELEVEAIPHATISKGSKQNQLGFLYSTKKIKNLDHNSIISPLVKVGEFLLFSLGVIHGQIVNTSNITRWSIDFRLKNHFTPVNSNLKSGYYHSFSSSPVTQIAREYYAHSSIEKEQLRLLEVDH